QQLSELCTLLVDDLYGQLSSRVFSVLARYGRLSIRGLVRYSDLSPRDLKHGLAVLIQQHLVLHHTGIDDTHYEPDWKHAYALVRSGKVIKFIEDRLGASAGGVAANLLLLGHAKINDLAEAYGVAQKHDSAIDLEAHHINGTGLQNGTDINDGAAVKPQNHVNSREDLHRILQQLLDAGFVTPIRVRHFQPDADQHVDAMRIAKYRKFPNQEVKGAKMEKAVASEAWVVRRKFRDEPDRRATEDTINQPRKRMKAGNRLPLVNGIGGTPGPADSRVVSLDDDLVIGVNQSKCDVALRTQALVDLCQRYLGDITAKVYEALLRELEKKVDHCYDPFVLFEDVDEERDSFPAVICRDALQHIDPDLDLESGIGRPGGQTNGVKHEEGDLDEEEEEEEDLKLTNGGNHVNGGGNIQGRLKLVKAHAEILAADPRKFVTWVSSRGGGEYKVDVRRLCDILVQTQIETTVSARWGPIATRLVRILNGKGKLDEKQVSNLAMLRSKEVRAALTNMQEAGFVDTQEVPKDATRQPSRTMYFWFYDQDRVRQLILMDTYKGMSRLMQRIKVERSKVQAVIDKAERTDVVGNEDRYLTGTEKQALRGWRDSEEKLLTQLARQDDLVAVFRDF
ncbi:hypothetical protein K490DRAFT_10284, partial [Saccharata proteae CBS 121410]